jgi:NADPH:quinone reductase-like Zn-dependent oxidoreductase
MNSTATTPTVQKHHTMRAITQRRYGAPEVLEYGTVAVPEPADEQVLIEIHAASVNQGDALAMRGWPYAARLTYGLTRPRRAVPGNDIAGRVVAVGATVEGVEVGDHVVGWALSGAFAPYTTATATSVVPKPETLSLGQAAAMPTAGVAALQAVRDAGRVSAGIEVLVVGASGGVGTFAVQIAAAHGARVTGVASGRNAELVQSLGAAAVVDYTRDDFTSHTGRYDVIVDLVGNQPIGRVRRALTPTGTLVVVGGDSPHSLTGMRRFAAAAAMSPFSSQRLVPLFSKPAPGDLATLTDMIDAGTLRPVIDRSFDLAEAADAVAHIETGRSRGKVVITTEQGALR